MKRVKQKFFIHQVSFRMLDPDFKLLLQMAGKSKRSVSDYLRELIKKDIHDKKSSHVQTV